jgi:hypothetical protein
MAQNPIDDVTKVLKDALYVSVGLGVLAFQRAQVQRQELRKRIERTGVAGLSGADPTAQISKITSAVDDRVKDMEQRVDAVEERIEALLDQLESRLPAQVQDVTKQVRAVAKEARHQARDQVRGLVGRVNGAS